MLASSLWPSADLGGKARYRKPVAVDAEAADRGEGGLGRKGVVAKTLAGMDVADVDFDGRNLHADDGVVQRDRGVGIGAGIDDDADRLGAGLVDEVDQLALPVGLAAIGGEAEMLRRFFRAKR